MNKLTSHKKRRRATLIAFGPELKERITAVRSELGIPLDGFPIEKPDNFDELKGFPPN